MDVKLRARRSSLGLFAMVFFLAALPGCSLDANLSDIQNKITTAVDDLIRKEPDFVQGEVVTSPNGYVTIGVFGETVENKTANGYQIDAVFTTQ